jgi:cyclic pyranopterin phosphate synthase
MVDSYGRVIDYMRISVTDRCNLHCSYCRAVRKEDVPGWEEGPESALSRDCPEAASLRDDEILRIVRIAAQLGIRHFRITGGEPLLRPGVPDLVRSMKECPGVSTVTLTTNGICLERFLDDLKGAGLDGVNISLDTPDRETYRRLTGSDLFERAYRGLELCASSGIPTKLNCVLLEELKEGFEELARTAARLPVDVRFIELMPIGEGRRMKGADPDALRRRLKEIWPDLHPVKEKCGFGPAKYETAAGLRGRIGWIGAVSHSFCESCNRLRLTSRGFIKPCLCYGEGIDLLPELRPCGAGQADDGRIAELLKRAISRKPEGHSFSDPDRITESKGMSEIGG